MRSTVHHLSASAHPHPEIVFPWLNVSLMIVALALLMYYVVQVNAIASQTWKLSDAHDRMIVVQDEHNGLVAQRAALDDRQALTVAAQTAGLVPAGTVVYLIQDHSVAAR